MNRLLDYPRALLVRVESRRVGRALRKFRLLLEAVALTGGPIAFVRKGIKIFHSEGLTGLRRRLHYLDLMHGQTVGTDPLLNEDDSASNWLIVSYYVDPQFDTAPPQCFDAPSIAVHLHLSKAEMLNEIIERLALIPCRFDLFVSVPVGGYRERIPERLRHGLPRLGQLVVEDVPNRGRDMAPLIVQFGDRLSQYAIIGHFHTGTDATVGRRDGLDAAVLDHLLGAAHSSGGRIAHLFSLLQSKAKFIDSEGCSAFLRGETGWAGNFAIAKRLLEGHPDLSIESFSHTEFPEASMFWARGNCLQEFLALRLAFDDFPEEPLAADGTLVQALERLVMVFARAAEGQFLRLHHGDSIKDYRNYEERRDFSASIVHGDVKVLAYYLPQFHPTVENDAWHGEGFTEWTKVRAANPLFNGHYQQHIPHPDIGYYLLDNAATLRVQAEFMRGAGVHGMIFYHYWFGGKMILERPARMLFDTPDIEMPFCFCWANENWTRRWDGNESEILLAQNYSEADARAFIRYLIPFFQDPRYLLIEGRPILFIYRASSIPDFGVYIKIWAEECRSAGLPAPYLAAVLTRGTTHPGTLGADAGAERVLHDWTQGGTPEIKARLVPYTSIEGSVLDYDDVADFYEAQDERKDFTFFRSLVPMWDNTARYGSKAYVVHGSTPARFQQWLESSIRFSQRTLPADRRLVLVNAWNEWAEGAHLEPDTRFGYAYLNAIGRALSGVPYSAQLNPSDIPVDGVRLHLVFPQYFCDWLAEDSILAQRFFHMLSGSSIFERCVVTVDAERADQFSVTAAAVGRPEDAEFVLEFRKLAFFGPRVIERMIQTGLSHTEAVIVPNWYHVEKALIKVGQNGSIRSADARSAPMILFRSGFDPRTFKQFLMRTDALCFPAELNTEPTASLPVVTTIIRIHKSADFELLRNALYCVAAMRNCICVPLIAAQDLSVHQSQILESLLQEHPWYPGRSPVVEHYRSADGQGDLRSRMLNESLRKVETRYAGLLDYDDLLMPHAYEWLIGRLSQTGKAVAFGRVYCTGFSNKTGLILNRSRKYEYGYSYEEFFDNNHSPLHSFLLDVDQIDFNAVFYYDDQRYMEDYFLTLQIFNNANCDWDSLGENLYIGDYIHSVDRAHTLAFATDVERQLLLQDAEYQLCEVRIGELRLKIARADKTAR